MVLPIADSPRIVVGLDFGTTFSGFAFAHRSDPEDVQLFIDWPGATRPYCKTQTSLFYSVQSNGELRLRDWGWTALQKYTEDLQSFQSNWVKHNECPPRREEVEKHVGYFITSFKLLLADSKDRKVETAPGGLTAERLIVDYLKRISEFIISYLKNKYGKTLTMRDVQWCLTVPAIWSQQSKRKMQVYAEMAGLVQGQHSHNSEASSYSLKIILEPEAASFSCLRLRQLRQGDKFMVVDLGGGTIDIVVHEKDEDNKVHEVTASSGDLGGGTFVDRNFFELLNHTIGCFHEFSSEEPATFHRIVGWWMGPGGKSTFDGTGSKVLEIPRKLAKAWKMHDRQIMLSEKDDDFYEVLEISEEQMQAIFDTEVMRTVDLIRAKLSPEIKYVFLVGGFAENQYMLKKIKAEFEGEVEDVISVPNAGAAVCRGAVAIGFETGVVLSRISKKWYGIRTSRAFQPSDPPSFKCEGQLRALCKNIFGVFVEKGASVTHNHVLTRTYSPIYQSQTSMEFPLFCSGNDQCPKYTTDAGCEAMENYDLDMKEDLHLGTKRSVKLSLYFGRATVEVSAQRLNFGSDRTSHKIYSVNFDAATV